jgi:hypothetical protein
MINDLVHDRNGSRAVLTEGGLVRLCDRYGVSEGDRLALASPGWNSLGKIGIPPVLQILFALQLSDEARDYLSWKTFEDRLEKEIRQPVIASRQRTKGQEAR